MHVPVEPSLGNLPVQPGVTANAGPVSFPYVATYFDSLVGGPVEEPHAVYSDNFPYVDHGVNNSVEIRGGTVYCGMARQVRVDGGLSLDSGLVFLNLSDLHTATPTGSLAKDKAGQVSILLYYITSTTITDYRDRIILPLYS